MQTFTLRYSLEIKFILLLCLQEEIIVQQLILDFHLMKQTFIRNRMIISMASNLVLTKQYKSNTYYDLY